MTTTQLECFVNIANTMNFMKTAELMHITQPAISKQLQSLENELGVKLIERTTHSVSLTPIGSRFLPEAMDMLKTWYHAQTWMSSYSEAEQRSIRIGYSDPHAMNNISRTLGILHNNHENISPRFTLDQTDANLARLERGQLDLVISMRDHSYKNRDTAFMEMMIDSFYCVVCKDHPLAKASTDGTVNTDDFGSYPQIISIPSYLRTNNFLSHHSIIPINENVTNIMTANAAECYGLILAGYGFSLVPGHLLMPHPNLVFLKWENSPTSAMGIYHKKGIAKDNPILLEYLQIAKDVYSDNYQSLSQSP